MPPYDDPKVGDRIAVADDRDVNAMRERPIPQPITLARNTELVVSKLESPGWVMAEVCGGPHRGDVVMLRFHAENYRLLARA